jgi:hypothetical protein
MRRSYDGLCRRDARRVCGESDRGALHVGRQLWRRRHSLRRRPEGRRVGRLQTARDNKHSRSQGAECDIERPPSADTAFRIGMPAASLKLRRVHGLKLQRAA